MRQAERGRVDEGAGTEVVDERDRPSPSEGRELVGVRVLDEARLAEVRAVDPQDERAATLRERRIEVRRAGAVRRPDLDEPGAGAPHDLGDAHATPDLDELAARDDDAAATREPDRERQGGRVVVRDEGILRARERDEMLLRRAVAAPPAAALAIELEQDRSRRSAAPRPRSRRPATRPDRGSCGR